MNSDATNQPPQDSVEESTDAQAEAPKEDEFSVLVSVPAQMEVRLVDASTLSDYENFGIMSGLASSAFFGFLVAWVQENDVRTGRALLAATLLSLCGFVAMLVLAIAKRAKLKAESRTTAYRRSVSQLPKGRN